MAAAKLLGTAILFLLVTGCATSRHNISEHTQFRGFAQDTYRILDTPSCVSQATFNRNALLQSELAAIGKFEQDHRGSATEQQLTVAKQDAHYNTRHSEFCWPDDDILFAQEHVKITRKTVSRNLGQLAKLARHIPHKPDKNLNHLRDASAFRHHVDILTMLLNPTCPISRKRDNATIMAPALRLANDFKQELAGTPYAIHFDIAEADTLYKRSMVSVECPYASEASPESLSAKSLAAVEKVIAQIRQVMI